MMMTSALDFNLPDTLNASHPPEKRNKRRDQVRMMVLSRETGTSSHTQFSHLADYLHPGDMIILNNSRTIPASLKAKLIRGQSENVEVRLAKRLSQDTWEALILTNSIQLGDSLLFSSDLFATVIKEKEDSPIKTIQFSKKGTELFNTIYSIGEPIRYEYIEQPWSLDYYQTVFASHPGSVEMPSAGRAFSWELLFDLKQRGIQIEFLQLHTGLSYLEERNLKPEENFEEYHISEVTMKKIQKTKLSGKRIIAVGTTVVRAIESAARSGTLSGWTNLYIHPNTPLQLVDGIITGFHEPKASHLDMLTAFVSEHSLLQAYREAIQSSYLWHEFGDINLIL